MRCWSDTSTPGHVALLAEGVDRNWSTSHSVSSLSVALLAEGVDRNADGTLTMNLAKYVALLAEDVDRNSE